MIGFGNRTTLLSTSIGGVPFNPLQLNPTFWFDYNNYPLGNFVNKDDETLSYQTSSKNGAAIALDSGINVLECTRASNNAANYNSNFITQLRSDHSHLVTYKPKEINPTFDCIFGVLNGIADQYGLFHYGRKLRLFIRIGGVNSIIESVSDVLFTTDTFIIVVGVSQNLCTIEVNGVNIPLTQTDITSPSTLSSINTVYNLYLGSRNSSNVADTSSSAFYGDHLLIPRLLTNSEKTNLINYFV